MGIFRTVLRRLKVRYSGGWRIKAKFASGEWQCHATLPGTKVDLRAKASRLRDAYNCICRQISNYENGA